MEMKEERGRKIIHLNVWNKQSLSIDKEKSLRIRFKEEEKKEAEGKFKLLEDLKKKANKELKHAEGHENHEVKRFIDEIKTRDLEEHRLCAKCDRYLEGKLLRGIQNLTEGLVYHEECYYSNSNASKSDPEPVSYYNVEENDNIPNLQPINHISDFDLQTASRDEAEDILKYRCHGAFLLRYSNNNKSFIISVKKDKTIDHYTIGQKVVNNDIYYWLVEGDAQTSFIDLVERHRDSHQLYTPYTMSDPEESPYDDEDDDEDDYDDYKYVEQEEEESSEEEDEAELEGALTFNDYFHGQINRKQANLLLKGLRENTFIGKIY